MSNKVSKGRGKKTESAFIVSGTWWAVQDLNLRPTGYEPNELYPPREVIRHQKALLQAFSAPYRATRTQEEPEFSAL